ncbi:dolichyl-diphosphooligosaccharide--protein glycotransferase subunit NDAI_0I03100 [Naumovozyma dairenensis CBS 421]|uniref:Dolichyl-diphosphooligosaccharide-protein glycosyltransferase subunit OST5 n=1 Tax=Naumovozyma dairenensis (strain ATCC 10597 / BCRC 20456 / CBS 421 / NBRC 0211 / NRRL Y-12639) TaxID=1071378 RepID=G0WGG7_NAUDC|nr:hypothetical protein NDAI_0I03100 [Naumovozyma dairenensis CBS 421]CCD26878.1 hypothetical protein NDAI_0I03100 [Naumovozyma dairenensis CBS 421]
MAYEELYREFNDTVPFQPIFQLATQPKFAIIASIISLLLITLSLSVSSSEKHFMTKLIFCATINIMASGFVGIAAVFAANSFGVYV